MVIDRTRSQRFSEDQKHFDLAYPDFTLHTDASRKGLGAVLYQRQGDKKRVRVIGDARGAIPTSEKSFSKFKLQFLAPKWL